MSADVVVVNHHLFFADMALRDTGLAELLPSVDVALFDEAHQLTEAGVQFLGTTLGTSQMIDFARDLLAVGLQQARGLQPWQDIAAACDRAARDLRIAAAGSLRDLRGMLRLRWKERALRDDFLESLRASQHACEGAVEALGVVEAVSPDFSRLSSGRGTSPRSRSALPAIRRPGRCAGSTSRRSRRVSSNRRSTFATRCASRWRPRRRPGCSRRRRSATTRA